jgi:hydrogenase-4 component B
VLVGVALRVPEGASLAVAGAALYAMHHGFAKGALFVGVGVLRAESRPRWHRLHLLAAGLPAVALAGLPLTSGALAKLALKDTAGLLAPDVASLLTLALSLTAAGTTVLMGRFLFLVATPAEHGTPGALVVPWLVLLTAVAGASWLVPGVLLPEITRPALTPGVVWDGLWPLLLGVTAVIAARALAANTPFTVRPVPAGDAVVPLERLVTALGSAWDQHISPVADRLAATKRALQEATYRAAQSDRPVDRFDRRLTRWRTAGALFVLLGAALVLAAALTAG